MPTLGVACVLLPDPRLNSLDRTGGSTLSADEGEVGIWEIASQIYKSIMDLEEG